jgi:hypothetical protein
MRSSKGDRWPQNQSDENRVWKDGDVSLEGPGRARGTYNGTEKSSLASEVFIKMFLCKKNQERGSLFCLSKIQYPLCLSLYFLRSLFSLHTCSFLFLLLK